MRKALLRFAVFCLLCTSLALTLTTTNAQNQCPGGLSGSACTLLSDALDDLANADSYEFLFGITNTTQMSSFINFEMSIQGTGYIALEDGEITALDLFIDEATMTQAGFMGFGSTQATYVGRLLYVDNHVFFGYGTDADSITLAGLDLSEISGSQNIDWSFDRSLPDRFMALIPGSQNNWAYEGEDVFDDGTQVSLITNSIVDTNPIASSMATLGTLMGQTPSEDAAYGTIMGMFGAGMDIQGVASYFGQWWLDPEGEGMIGWASGQQIYIDLGNMFGDDLFSLFVSTDGGYSQRSGVRIVRLDPGYTFSAPEEFEPLPSSTANTIAVYGANGMPSILTGLFYPLGLAGQTVSTGSTTTSSTPAMVVEGGLIEFGGSVTETLNTNERVQWTFEGEAGDVVTINLSSPDFDTYVELLDSDGNQLTYNDDGGDGLNSLISGFTLPADGTYTIVARGYRSSASGSYTLELVLGTNTGTTTTTTTTTTNASQAGGGEISYGQSMNSNLVVSTEDEWTFEGEAGDVVTISLDSSAFDTYLELMGPNGNQVTFNDDGGNGLNSLISGFALPTTGTYTIITRGYRSSASGSYTVTLQLDSDGSSTTTTINPSTSQSGGAITYGETVTANLVANAEDAWTFEGETGDVIIINLTSQFFDTYLELENPAGVQITYNDDGGDGLNSLISGFVLPTAGRYTIIARGFSSSANGSYTLTLEQADTIAPGAMVYGDIVTGFLASGIQDRWTFEGDAGDIVTISLNSPDFDTYLELLDGSGVQVMYNDDGGDGLNSLITQFRLPQTGTYTILARGYSSGATGDYTLTLQSP